jgi:hypothetical protein
MSKLMDKKELEKSQSTKIRLENNIIWCRYVDHIEKVPVAVQL